MRVFKSSQETTVPSTGIVAIQQLPTEPRDNRTDEEKQVAVGEDEASDKIPVLKGLGWVDRLLALWIFLAIALGILLGNLDEKVGPVLEDGEFVGVSVPIAIGLLVMMYPILCKIKFETLHLVFKKREFWVQIAFSLVMNWIVSPLLMLGLAWAFLPDQSDLREGLILVGLARCIAMVLIWTDLSGGDSEYCAILVAVNSILQIVLYAPLAILYINIISRETIHEAMPSYSTISTSVAVFLGIPLAAAILTRIVLYRLTEPGWYERVFLKWISPLSLLGLLYTIIVLFASQGDRVVHQIASVARVAAPLVVYFFVVFGFALWATHRCGFGYRLAATQSFTAASNNFELAIAVAVATYGSDSDQALASTVGPLVEVPVLLSLVYVARWIRKRKAWRA